MDQKVYLTEAILAFTLLMALCQGGKLLSQPFQQGHITLQLVDSSRNNRPVPAEIFYPAMTAGEGVPVAPGPFPVLSFGHGFVMTVDAYVNFSDVLVPKGYITAFSRTETGISPDHDALALDMLFILQSFSDLNNDMSSLFFGTIAPTTAIMGHSMGGGASFLAAAVDPSITALVTFAAANTDPSAIIASQHITIPALLFSGSGDCVTPPAQHQQLMYDSLASSCKSLVSITGGGHCYFANYNLLCTIGENSCSPNLTISREQQQDVVFDLLVPWLDHFLKGDTSSYQVFLDSLSSSVRLTYEHDCGLTSLEEKGSGGLDLKLFPVPFREEIILESDEVIARLDIYDCTGRKVHTAHFNAGRPHPLILSFLAAGAYQMVVTASDGRRSTRKAIKM
jgi:hypothetical protein